MSDGTKIEWADATLNAINGCTIVSPGCTNCYAMRLAGTRMKHHPTRAGLTREVNGNPVWTGEVRLVETALDQALRWRRGRKIFWNAHGDTFHEKVPVEWIDRQFAVMAATPHHIHEVLTKRPERAREYLRDPDVERRVLLLASEFDKNARPEWPLRNVWLGTSVEDQKRAIERVPILLDTPAAVRWLSCEPLLGPVNLRLLDVGFGTIDALSPGAVDFSRIDWVVVGGESGPGSRPMHPEWARSLRDQCEAAEVAFHFKQWGDWHWFEAADLLRRADAGRSIPERTLVYEFPDRREGRMVDVWRIGKKEADRVLDGRKWDGWPQ